MATIVNSQGVPFQPSSGKETNASLTTNTGTLGDMSDDELRMSILSGIDVSQIDLTKLTRSELMRLQRLLTPKITKFIPHVPTPKQTAFLLLDCKEAFYGGAAGGGKSDALLMGGLQFVDVKGYAGIIFRKTYADLTKPGALIDRAREWLNPFIQTDEVRWDEKNKKFNFMKKYGKHAEIWSILQFGYLETPNDRFNYQGGEYQFIGFDELTHIDQTSYKYMFSRLRRLKNVQIPLRVRSGSNPPEDDMGDWVRIRFVEEGPSKGRVFIPAGMDDNPHLDRESYESALDELDPVTRARLKEGNWEIIRKGNMFKREWFETVDAPPAFRRRIRFWDMAATDPTKQVKKKKSTDPDYTVGFLMSEASGIFYIEDILRIRKRPAETNLIQRNTAKSDGYSTVIREEQEPGSSGISTIDQKARLLFLGYNYNGVRSTGSKVQRAATASSAAERGHIKIVRGCRNIDAFFDEAEIFPGGVHDDMVDGLSGAYSELCNLPKDTVPINIESEEGSYWIDEEEGSGYYGGLASYV